MRYKSLRIAIIAGIVVKFNQEIELNEKAAKPYIEAGFIEEINEDTPGEQTEPEVKQEEKKKGK